MRQLQSLARKFCSHSQGYMITTPIFYVNSSPHLGHLYSCLLADAHQRYTKLSTNKHKTILFSTGTDEHGLKVQQAASKAKLTPEEFVGDVSNNFRDLFNKCDLEYTDFVRTSDEKHKEVVRMVWQRMKEAGALYKSEYAGWYSVQEEAFVPDTQVEERGGQHFSTETGQRVDWAREENWMFRLSEYRDSLISWHRHQSPVSPSMFRGQVSAWLSEGLGDLSVSRPAERLQWGVKVPEDHSQTVYVWIDALVNYLTASRYPDLEVWPPSVQVLGKDILKFHSIYWPAMLMCLDLDLPHKLLVHSHWTVDNVKMSKSIGNVVDPNTLMEKYSSDGLRYFLLREGVPHSDGNFSESSMVQLLNLELADTLGNLLNRCSSKGVNREEVIPRYPAAYQEESRLHNELESLQEEISSRVGDSYKAFNFYQGIVLVMDLLRLTNQFVQTVQPWTLKQESDRERLHWVLAASFESLRISGILLQPVVPGLAARLLDKLNIEKTERDWASARPGRRNKSGQLAPGKTVLFQKIR